MSKTGFYKGRLGIGLTSTMGMGDGNPRYPLDINGDIRLTGAIVNGNGLAINMVTPDSMWQVGEGIISYETGNVGIGTTSPDAKLHISGSGSPTLKIVSLNHQNPGIELVRTSLNHSSHYDSSVFADDAWTDWKIYNNGSNWY